MSSPLLVRRWADLDVTARAAFLARGLDDIFDPALQASIAALVADVREHGDAAICRALERFDGCSVAPGDLRVTDAEFAAARAETPAAVQDAIRQAIDHSRRFNERALEHGDWRFDIEPGLMVGEKRTAIASAGLFVPSGKGSFPSVLVQIGTPAVVAGVPEIRVVVPPIPGSDGKVDPAVLVVAHELGLREVFRANGPAGVAALAFGTESISACRKVLGPGSPPVASAQLEMQRHGVVGMQILAASESMVIADATADSRLLAADLLNEAEHGTDSASVLLTWEPEVIERVQPELVRQLAALPEPRRTMAAAAIGVNGGAVLVRDRAEAIEVANLYAPEHMQLATADDEAVLAGIEHAGEVLLGQHTPFSAGNYLIGIPATLPTSGYARVTSGVTALAFTKTISLARASAEALAVMAPAIVALADHEGFPAHAAVIHERLDPQG
ncbi:MAG: histidinol dehydrogenase [Gaiellales bacterium]|jgi:histidinol dehydrogenase|nr:histidinol dehydrogenase [Gaiellales bacterium]